MRCRMRCGDIWRCGGPIKKAPFVPVNSMLVDVDEQTDTFSVRVYSTNEDDLHYVQLDWTSGGTVGVSYVRKGDNEYNHNIFTQNVVDSMVQTIEQSYQDGTLFDGIYTFTEGAREAISDYFAEPITPESTAEMQQALGSMPIVEDGYYTVKFVSNNTNYGTVDLELVNIRQGLERYIYASKEEYDYNTIEGYIDIMTGEGEYEDNCAAVPEYLGSEEYTYVFDKFTYDSATGTQVPFDQEVLINRDMTIYANFKRQKCKYEVSFDIDPSRGSVSPDSIVAEYGDLVSWNGGNTFTIGSTTVTVTPVGNNTITEVDMNGGEIIGFNTLQIHMAVPLVSLGPVSDVSISGIGTEATVNVPITPYDADVDAYDFDIMAGNCEVGEPEIVTSGQSTNLRFTLTSSNSGLAPGSVTYMPSYGQIGCNFNIEVIAGPEYLDYEGGNLTVQIGEPQTIEINYYPEEATDVLEHVTVESDSEDLTCVLNYAYNGIIVANVLATNTFARHYLDFYLDDTKQFIIRVRAVAPQVQSISYDGGPLSLTVGEPITFDINYSPNIADFESADVFIEDPDGMAIIDLVSASNGVATYIIDVQAEYTGTLEVYFEGAPEISINYEATDAPLPTPVQSLSYNGGIIDVGTTEGNSVEIPVDVLPIDAEDFSNVGIDPVNLSTSTSLGIEGFDGDGHLVFYGRAETGLEVGGVDIYSVSVDGVEQFQIMLATGSAEGIIEVRSYYEDITPNVAKNTSGQYYCIVNYYPTDVSAETVSDALYIEESGNITITDIQDQRDGTIFVYLDTGAIGTGCIDVYLYGDLWFQMHMNVTEDGADTVETIYQHRIYGSIVHNISMGQITLTDRQGNTITICDKDVGATTYYDPSAQAHDPSEYGAYFEWGNNYPFTDDCLSGGSCTQELIQQDATGYSREYPFMSSIYSYGYDEESGEYVFESWDVSNNTDLWGYDSIQSDSSLYGIANRGPCKPYTYMPDFSEWQTLFTLWNRIRNTQASDPTIIQEANIGQFCTDILSWGTQYMAPSRRGYEATVLDDPEYYETPFRAAIVTGRMNSVLEAGILNYDWNMCAVRPFFSVNVNS